MPRRQREEWMKGPTPRQEPPQPSGCWSFRSWLALREFEAQRRSTSVRSLDLEPRPKQRNTMRATRAKRPSYRQGNRSHRPTCERNHDQSRHEHREDANAKRCQKTGEKLCLGNIWLECTFIVSLRGFLGQSNPPLHVAEFARSPVRR